MTARLLGNHPPCLGIPIEVRFITDPGGLCDLAEGRTGFRRFMRRILRRRLHRVLLVRLGDLVEQDRDAEPTRICAFLRIGVDPSLRDYFESDVIPQHAHIGRWMKDIPADRRGCVRGAAARTRTPGLDLSLGAA